MDFIAQTRLLCLFNFRGKGVGHARRLDMTGLDTYQIMFTFDD